MARTNEVKNDGSVHILPPRKKKAKAQAESKETPPPSRPLNEETPPSRPLNEENPALRALKEDTTRLSASSEEAVLDTSLSAQSKERASSSTQSPSSRSEEDQRVINVTVMSKGKEITTALTVLGKVPQSPAVQQKTEDSANPVQEDKKDEGSVEVNYNSDSTDEEGQSALRIEPTTALVQEPTTALVQEPSSHHEKRSAEDTSDSELSITSDLIMREGPGVGSQLQKLQSQSLTLGAS
jgi:hypothetical protein